jgi:hypothetical protein
MKLHEILCHLLAEVNAWWEWFLTTITGVDPTELIAVENRSHNILELLFRMQRSFVFYQTGRLRLPATPLNPKQAKTYTYGFLHHLHIVRLIPETLATIFHNG